MIEGMLNLEVCFSPALYCKYENPEAIVAVIDIFRASSAIAAAFSNGVHSVIPVASIEDARMMKEKGYLLAAERNGLVLDFADFGNSPYNFMTEAVRGKTIAYSTTNGTQAIHMAARSHAVVIASFINHSAVLKWLTDQNRDVLLLCAGWKDKFSFEDSVYAGALCRSLLDTGRFQSKCDSVLAACDLWELAAQNISAYKEKFAHRHRLKKMGLDDCVDYCLTFDVNDAVPVFRNGEIRNVNKSG
jgi:2-phosphosulfolactate phosphatase